MSLQGRNIEIAFTGFPASSVKNIGKNIGSF